MIINTGNRTDIPAFFSKWFFNRLHAGFVDVKNPYANNQYWRYLLNPNVVDVIAFCSKNPKPMLDDTNEMNYLLSTYKTFWYMTITPYSTDIEKKVPDIKTSIETFKTLSNMVGKNVVGWRYDPILFGNGWNIQWHLKAFTDIAAELKGYTNRVVISFLDNYQKVAKNAAFAVRPDNNAQSKLVKELVQIANANNMELYVCHDENKLFASYGANVTGCASLKMIENATGLTLKPRKKQNARNGCNCILNADIGMYNTCLHECVYCYANVNHKEAKHSYLFHDVNSSCIIGQVTAEDEIKQMKQESWL